jgi:predicted NAD-dependent protein-ADP-ribosyltransferase YbiA (DUF1768 family)
LTFFGDRDVVLFNSSEHVWQALKATTALVFNRFTTDGDIGTWSQSIFTATKKKMPYWKKKHGIGIQAKLAANSKHGKALRLGPTAMDYWREKPATLEDERGIWLAILRAKFTQNPELRQLLVVASHGHYLVEFVESAKKSGNHWGGVYDAATYCIHGENVMGKYLMELREELSLV